MDQPRIDLGPNPALAEPLIEVVDPAAEPAADPTAAAEPADAQLHPEARNLAPLLPPEELAQLAREVIEQYEEDLQSRSAWDEQHKFWTELYYQNDYAMSSEGNDDRTWGATESLPILTEAANQFAARGRKTFFPNRDFVSATVASLGLKNPVPVPEAPVAPGSPPMDLPVMQQKLAALRDRAQRVAKHMNFQLNYELQDYKENKVALFLSTAVHGMMFTKAYPDFSTGAYVPKVDNVRGVDLVVPYMVGPVAMEDLPRKTHRLYPTVLETEMMARAGFFTSRCKAPASLEGAQSGQDKAAQQAEGISPSTPMDAQSMGRQALVLECHRFWEITDPANPGEKIIAPVIVWVDHEAKEVKRLAIRYETDADGNPTNNRRPVEYFTPYRYFPNPDGFYGYGLGQMIGQINSAANITYRQVSDAATLANDGNMSGFISNRLAGEDGEEVVVSLGRFAPVPDTVGDINDGIFQFKFPGPAEASFKLLELLISTGNRLGGSTEAVTGTVDKVVQPTTLLTQLEQGLELPSSVMMGIAQSISEELMKVYRLNRVHMTKPMYFVVDDEVQEVTPEDYAADLRVQPVFDAKMVIKAQRVALAQAELDASLKNPNNQARPQVIDAAFRRYFKALEVDDVDQLVPPPPPVPRFNDQRKENMMFLMPGATPPDVFPDQNHQTHLAEIDAFMKTPFGMQLQPEGAQALMLHRQKHVAYLYGEQAGVDVNGAGGTIGPAEGAGVAPAAAAGLGPVAGNPFGAGDAAGALPPAAPQPAGAELGIATLTGGAEPTAGGFDQLGGAG
jgi:hypothetical protein